MRKSSSLLSIGKRIIRHLLAVICVLENRKRLVSTSMVDELYRNSVQREDTQNDSAIEAETLAGVATMARRKKM